MQHEAPLNLKQAAKAIGLERRQLVNWQSSPTPPPAFRIGRQWFFWKQELLEWNRRERKGKGEGKAAPQS